MKRRCLPVSGSKPQLIERLKPFTELTRLNVPNSNNQFDSQRSNLILNSSAVHGTSENSISEKNESVDASKISPSHQSAQKKYSSLSGKIIIYLTLVHFLKYTICFDTSDNKLLYCYKTLSPWYELNN